MSLVLGGGHRRHFHATTTCGAMAAAAVAARLTDSDEAAVVGAVRSAASTAGGTRQALAELSDTAIAHRAHAAVAGVVANRFAGVRPVRRPLGGELGLCAATSTTPDWATLDDALPAAITEVTVRTHPVSGFAHTMVDALRAVPTMPPGEVAHVQVRLPPALAAADRPGVPGDARAAVWNFGVVAALTVSGRLGVTSPDWPVDAETMDLATRVDVAAEPSWSAGSLTAEVEVETAEGDVHRARRDVPHGHPGDPLTDDELVARAVDLGAFDDAAVARGVLQGLRRTDTPIVEILHDVAGLTAPA